MMPRIPLAALAVFAALTTGAAAQSFSLSYTGEDTTFGSTYGAAGVGTLTLDSAANGSYGLADVTGFSFTLTNPSPIGTDVFNYGTADLVSFSATLTGGVVTALSLMTDIQPATYNYNQFLWVFDLGAGDAVTGNFDLPVTAGTLSVAAASVPEPSAIAVAGIGVAALGLLRRRRAA